MAGKKNKKPCKVTVVKGVSFHMSVQPKEHNNQHPLSAKVNSTLRPTNVNLDEVRQKFLDELEFPLQDREETCMSHSCHAVLCEARQMFMDALKCETEEDFFEDSEEYW